MKNKVNLRKRKNLLFFSLVACNIPLFALSCGCNSDVQEVSQSVDSSVSVTSKELSTSEKIASDTKVSVETQNFNDAIIERRFFVEKNQTPTAPFEYFLSSHHSYGLRKGKTLFGAFLMRTKAFGEPEISAQFSEQGLVTLSTKKPSYNIFKFVVVDKIVLVTEDDKTYVFDSDDYDLETVENNSQAAVRVFSNNPRSVNSKLFFETLKKAKKFSMSLKDAYWVDQKGEKTKYKLQTKDMLYSFLSSYLRTKEYRFASGGSQANDDFWGKTNYEIFQASSRYPNEYLLNVLDIDYHLILDLDNSASKEKKTLETILIDGVQTDVFSLYVKENNGKSLVGGFEPFFTSFISDSNLFLLAPSLYIDEQVQKRTDLGLDKHDGSGLIKQIGWYWYGNDYKQSLYAGYFVPSSREVVGGLETIIYKKNKFHAEKDWADNVNTIDTYVVHNQKRDDALFQEVLLSNFGQGISSKLDFASISPQITEKIRSNLVPTIPLSFLKFSTTINSTNIPLFFVHTTSPTPTTNATDYYYNDNYAKFMYGGSREDLAKGNVKSLKAFFGDDQIAFRSLLVAAVNWERAVSDFTQGQNIFSLTLAVPHAPFGGSNQETSPYKKPIEALELLNSPFTVIDGKRKLTIPHALNKEVALSLSSSESYMGGGKKNYEQMQEDMTALLDRVYKREGWDDSEVIEFSWSWYTTETSDVWNIAWARVLDTINSLDKKHRIRVIREQLFDLNEVRKRNAEALGARTFKRWGLDFAGNLSYVDAMLHGIGNFLAGYFSILVEKDEKDKDNPFPMLTRLAKLLDKGIKEGKYHFALPIREWINMTNQESFDYVKTLEVEGHITESEFTKFLFASQDQFTNEEMIDLDIEISILVGPKWNLQAVETDPNSGYVFAAPEGIYFPITSSYEEYEADISYVPLKKNSNF